uniref:Transcobalamin-2 n=1 Tax=Leptobrachium leishanense TaxID=445787 RepID=A0A8C5Q358_9ANUR
MALWWPVWAIMSQFLFVPVHLCDIPSGNSRLIESVNLKLLRATLDDVSKEANPSVYLGLRLSRDHNLRLETRYLKKLKNNVETITSSSQKGTSEKPSTGILALHLMALTSACDNLGAQQRKKIIAQLTLELKEEKKNIVTNNRPKSNYFQYSLGILALCVAKKKVDVHIINKLLNAEKDKKFVHAETTTVDTEAVAGMAFMCLKRSDLYTTELRGQLSTAVESVKQKILDSQNTDGSLGNIYSTGLAVQFLSALETKDAQTCSKATEALLEAIKQGKFSNPMMMSQIMPVLHGKSYLDVANVDCTLESDNLFISPVSVLPELPNGGVSINVQLVVEGPSGQSITHDIHVPSQSSLLDILETAQKQNSNFRYEKMDSLYGPYLTSVNGVKSSTAASTYWQLLKDPNISLVEGIADYKPGDGERIILRLSKCRK